MATSNPHKVEELRAAMPGWSLSGLERDDFPPEEGATYEENARIKALFGRSHAPAGAWALGEDSGIEARGLGDRPGVHSARWADDGVRSLLEALERIGDRRARYRCVIVAIAPDGAELVAEGVLDGRIDGPPRGREGFGYDPIFVPLGENRTVAELGDAWKRGHSHRARAARDLGARLAGS